MCAIVMLGFWSCFGKKPARPTLEEFIPQATGGELTYVSAIVDLDPKRLVDHKKKIILADARDSLVQLTVVAVTSAPDFGLDPAALREQLTARREEKRQAEGLYAAFAAAGMPDVSIAVIEGHSYIFLYAEPMPENRESITPRLPEAMREQRALVPVRLWVEWMDPATLRQETGPIVPYGYWHRGDTYHARHRLVAGAVDWADDITPEDLSKTWSTNTESDRMSRYADEAFAAVQAWAGKDSSRPSDFVRDSYVIWADEDQPIKVHFAFPCAGGSPDNQPDQPVGYVTGVYDPDAHTFTGIHTTDSL
jgi:hypothetical protein